MITGLIYLVVYIIVVGLILWLLRYVVNTIPMDEPFRRIANIIIVVVGALIVILLLLNFVGILDGGTLRLR